MYYNKIYKEIILIYYKTGKRSNTMGWYVTCDICGEQGKYGLNCNCYREPSDAHTSHPVAHPYGMKELLKMSN